MGKRLRAPCILHKPTGTQPQTFFYFLPHKSLLGDNSQGTGKKCERIHNACRQIIQKCHFGTHKWPFHFHLCGSKCPWLMWLSAQRMMEMSSAGHTTQAGIQKLIYFLMPLCCLPHERAALTNLSGMGHTWSEWISDPLKIPPEQRHSKGSTAPSWQNSTEFPLRGTLRKCLGCSSSSLKIKRDWISSVSPC